MVTNTYRPDAIEAAVGVAKWLRARGNDVWVDSDTARHVELPVVRNSEFGEADLVVAFGGDGTLIRAVHLCADFGTPILGVYFGRFGFVTQCTHEYLESCLTDFLEGRCSIESRMMLDAELMRAGQTVAHLSALNETVLQRAVVARMMTFQVTVDGHVLTSYPADGIIVATPTGSTAYNLSAGGPILDPKVHALVLTAIAPHTLNSRTLVLAAESEIVLKVQSHGDAVLSADGQTRLHLLSGDEVRVRKSTRMTNLVSVQKDDFLIKLGQRLLWSYSPVGDSL
ncbi:NAD(+) kinase [Fimbriimonas ginsengisoli Gsoil 348]|uniref:NAD kinase n=1 Tax=Fimbriimonas ginsengisoli Gsoil 348 TaxID=661478 RepID=A0A068NW39_FIMGI|nr:NAD(+) kinase [Fimbriimonas ginsengisoli Gsoil 348]